MQNTIFYQITLKPLQDLLFVCWETMRLIEHLWKEMILYFEYKNKVYYQLVLPLSAVHRVVNTENSDNEERICFIHGFLLLHWVLLRTLFEGYIDIYKITLGHRRTDDSSRTHYGISGVVCSLLHKSLLQPSLQIPMVPGSS